MSSDNVQLVLHFAVLTIVFHSTILVHTAKLKPLEALKTGRTQNHRCGISQLDHAERPVRDLGN